MLTPVELPRKEMTEVSKTKKNTQKCVIDIRNVPPAAYRLPTDGRKWMQECRNRKQLLDHLATYANGDGTSIKPSLKTAATALGWSRRTVTYLIKDLITLGLLEDGALDGFLKTRIRAINIEKVLARAQDSTIYEIKAPAQDSPSRAQNSQAPAQNRRITCAEYIPVTTVSSRPSLDRQTDRTTGLENLEERKNENSTQDINQSRTE